MPAKHGREWTPMDDLTLLQCVSQPNESLSAILGRSPVAILYRRSHLAAVAISRISGCDPDTANRVLGAAGHITQNLLTTKRFKEDHSSPLVMVYLHNMVNHVPLDVDVEFDIPLPQPPAPRPAFVSPVQPLAPKPAFPSDEAALDALCSALRDQGGRLGDLWGEQDLVPYIVRYHEGLSAYARFLARAQ